MSGRLPTPGPRPRRRRLSAENHRGELVPMTLGFALVLGAAAATVVGAALGHAGPAEWGTLTALVLVFTVGLVDDVSPSGPRGVRNHLRALASGRMTTGILKLVVIVASGVVVVALQPPRSIAERVAAIVAIAGCANLWNGLDVRPGRALKAFLVPGLAIVGFGGLEQAPAVGGVLVAALLALPVDLRERAMLGDAGSNLLGFAAGAGAAELLGGGWLVLVAVVVVALNVVADTITLSRVIERAAPLRWVDALGRRP